MLAVQERRGKASRVRSADGAAMFDVNSEIVQYADGCLVGDQPELQSPTAML